MTRAVRGAIRVAEDSPGAISEASVRLTAGLMARNGIQAGRIVSVLFSLTRDLSSLNPAAAARTLGLEEVPLLCLQEAEVAGAMPRVLRLLLTFDGEEGRVPVPVYLDGAEALRPDLFPGV